MNKTIKLLVFFSLTLQPMFVWATHCRIDGGADFPLHSGVNTIAVQPIPISGTIYSYGDIKLECRFSPGPNNPPHRVDYIRTRANGLSININGASGFKGGLLLGGSTQISSPLPADVILATLPSNGYPWIKVDITPYLEPANTPQSVTLSQNATIAELNLYQNNNYNGTSANLSLKLIAKNRITLWPNTCTVNGGGPLDIDFGSVIDSKISTNPIIPGQYTKPIAFTYSCSDQTVTQAIGITLQAPDTASFNNNLIGTSNGALGIALVKGTSVVPVNSTYNSQMVNGSGSDNITFNLVRSSGQLPATGDFNASAVLQIGLP